MSGERLAIILLTAHRLEYAIATLQSVVRNLHHDGPVHYHIASDGDDGEYIGKLWGIPHSRGLGVPTVTNAEGRGYGASYNMATQVVHPLVDYVMPLEDDWQLLRTLDTAPIMKVLANGGHQSKEEFAYAVPPPEGFEARCVRLGYLGFQWPVRADLFKVDETLWMALDPESPEQHIAAGHPRIETVQYQRSVGPWPEGLNPGVTELGWCQRPEARRGVVWPLTLVSLANSVSGDLFAHCGAVQSY